MKKAHILIALIILSSFVISIYFYPKVPDQMATHWNSQGEVNGYMSKTWGMFLIPLMLIPFIALFIIIPKIDPLKKNFKKFINYYDGLIIVLFIFLFFIHCLMILWNIGYQYDIGIMINIPIALLFLYMGLIMKHLKRNWFVGIRTPWTISDDKVWKKTHEKAAVVFKIAAVLTLVGLFFGNYSIWFLLVPILAGTCYLFIYSYFEYKKLHR